MTDMTSTANTADARQEIIRADCPECAAPVIFGRMPLNGEIAECPGCDCELEVTCRVPLRLELAPEVEEDWGE